MRRSSFSLIASSAALLALAVPSHTPLSAQILKRLGDRAKDAAARKTEEKVAQKIDAATERFVNRSFDSVFGDDSASKGKSSSRSGSRIFAMLPNAPTEARYDFDGTVTYEIESAPKGKPNGEVGLMVMEFNRDKQYAGARLSNKTKPSDGAFHMIFDVPNESMVMLFETDTGKFSMAYSWKEAKRYAAEQQAATPSSSGASAVTVTRGDGKQVQYTKLGSKRIAGYNAEGYRAEDAEGVVDVWVSNDAALSYGRLMGAAGSMKGVRGAMPDGYPMGMLMASESTEKKSGDQWKMTVTSIDTKAKVGIDMAQYPKLGAAPAK